jgi:membrane protein DedA with SNARE-associated domain
VADLDKAEGWFLRHGAKAVFFGRMIPLVRSLISVPAGIERMRIPMFLLLTSLGSLLWNATFIGAGYLLGDNWHLVERYAGAYSKAVVVVLAVAVVVFVAIRIRAYVSKKRKMASTRRL